MLRLSRKIPLHISASRVVYERDDGRLGPRNADDKLVDSCAPSPDRTIDHLKAHAEWVVSDTLWSATAHVQVLRPGAKNWTTIYTVSDA